MPAPYIILNLKADLSLQDCVHFLNEATEQGARELRQLFVALPFSRLKEINKHFNRSGILFGTQEMAPASPDCFTGSIAAKMVLNNGGSFTLIGAMDERKTVRLSAEDYNYKLRAAKKAKLKVLFCFGDTHADEAALWHEQLTLLKASEVLTHDPHPVVIYQLPFHLFSGYLPSKEELAHYYEKGKKLLEDSFEKEAEKIALIAALPADLLGFSNLLKESPFQGAFFSKSGIYPHQTHEEAISLVQIHCTET